MIDHQLFYNIVGGKREKLQVHNRREMEEGVETTLVGTTISYMGES